MPRVATCGYVLGIRGDSVPLRELHKAEGGGQSVPGGCITFLTASDMTVTLAVPVVVERVVAYAIGCCAWAGGAASSATAERAGHGESDEAHRLLRVIAIQCGDGLTSAGPRREAADHLQGAWLHVSGVLLTGEPGRA